MRASAVYSTCPLVVAGHSAGAHLASLLGLAQGDLPRDNLAKVGGLGHQRHLTWPPWWTPP